MSLQLQPHALAITVTNLNDSGHGSLREAIADTPAGGTIDFGVTGTIVLTSGQLVITNDLVVNGPGTTKLTLSQNSTNRILQVSSGNVIISGLTIANGNGVQGGGIYNLATLTLRSCLVASNSAYGGGGIANAATLVVCDSLITSNAAFGVAGGIWSTGTTTVIGSTICSNNANLGHIYITAGGIHHGWGGVI